MFTTVILITERKDGVQRALEGELRRHNRSLTIRHVLDRRDLDCISSREKNGCRIVAFCTDIVVPSTTLQETGFGAYNFHPGSPAYPGWAPASFAVYDQARRFGATAHKMAPKVDSGEIVGTNMFDVPPGADQTQLERMAYLAALELFCRLARHLAKQADPIPAIEENWASKRCTRRAYEEMCQISPETRVDELVRRICAFGAGPPNMRPVTMLQGLRYHLSGSVLTDA